MTSLFQKTKIDNRKGSYRKWSGVVKFKKEKIERIIRECDKHVLRIKDASEQMQNFMLLDSESYQHLSKLQIQIIDQFLFRFAKLQDSIGEKLFKAILIYLDEDVGNKPFIDILNRLEKLEILGNVEEWRELRELRNELSHTYDDEPEEMALAINKVFSKKNKIIMIYKNIKDYYESH